MTNTYHLTPIPLLLLAAGGSTRMGTPKQLLIYGGQSLLRHAAETALASVCRPIVVVLGANVEALRPELNGLDVTIVENPDWQEGMSRSLKVGVKSVQESKTELPASLLVMLCDQPFVTPELLNTLVRTRKKTGKPIVACAYDGSVGVPALFDRPLFGELQELEGAEGAKQILTRHVKDIAVVPFAEGAIDVDTPGDYARLEKKL